MTDVLHALHGHCAVVAVSFAAYVTRRTAFAVLTVYLVMSLTFAVVAFSPNTDLNAQIANMERNGATEEEVEEFVAAYEQRRGIEGSVGERYVGWLVDVSTLDLGYSFTYDRPVAAVLGDAVPRTGLYVAPALALALLLGTLAGAVAGEFGGLPDSALRYVAYALAGVPAFVGAFVYLQPLDYEWLRLLVWDSTPFHAYGNPVNPNAGLWPPSRPLRFLAPAVVFASTLVGWQLRYVRTAYLDHAGDLSTKLHEAKGAGRLRVARHVLRNAAVPIVSASLSELLVVALLGIYVVEAVFGIQGVAAVNMAAVRERDVPLIIWSSLVLALGGVLASYVQDLLYGYLDPRIGAE